ncbi:MAG: LptF/LptG family permease [Pseudomonadota bacterium]
MTLALYLSRLIALRVALSWVVLLLLAIGIDLLRTSSDLIEQGGPAMVARYAWFQVPVFGSILMPISVLTGATVTFLSLSGRSEMTVIRAAGRSIGRVLFALVPLALVFGGIHYLFEDPLNAWSQKGLSRLFPLEIETSLEERVWSREGQHVVRASPVADDGSVLSDVTIFRLDREGKMTERLTAETARFLGDGWQLEGVVRLGTGEAEIIDSLLWETQTTPVDIFRLAEGQRSVTPGEARAVLSGDAVPIRGQPYYETRAARGYVVFLMPAVMLMLAALSAFGTARYGGGMNAVLAVVLGFLYIAVDGFVASLGEVGAVAPTLAAFGPSGLFLITAAWFLLQRES